VRAGVAQLQRHPFARLLLAAHLMDTMNRYHAGYAEMKVQVVAWLALYR
jgi:hypothetical protein